MFLDRSAKLTNGVLCRFAYLFFREPEAVTKAIELSEQKLDGRPLLVKDANNFERKDGVTREEVVKQKNKPCSTLFLGNLPFDADKKSLREHFKDCEGLLNIRVGTFEDSGKCKGYVSRTRLKSMLHAQRLVTHVFIASDT